MLSDARIQPTLPAKDMGRAKKFYQGTLGLSITEENPGGITFQAGDGTTLAVYPSGFAGSNKATAAEWQVKDIQAAIADLKGKGVTFEEYDMPELKTVDGVATLGSDKAAWFKDSEGNILAIFQRG